MEFELWHSQEPHIADAIAIASLSAAFPAKTVASASDVRGALFPANALLRAGGKVYHGFGTVLRFIGRTQPSLGLVGENVFAQTEVDQWVALSSQIHEHFMVNELVPPGPMRDNTAAALTAALHTLNAKLLLSTFAVDTQRPTIADMALMSVLAGMAAQGKADDVLGRFPNIARWYNTCAHQPHFRSVLGDIAAQPTPPSAAPSASAAAPSAPAASREMGPHFSNASVERLHATLRSLGVPFPVPTNPDVEAEKASWAKSLFVSGKVGKKDKRFFLLTTGAEVKPDLKGLSKLVGVKELRLGSPEDMASVLHVSQGCVTAMTTFMDEEGRCQPVIDKALFDQDTPLRMCAGCNDALDHSQHNISCCKPSALHDLFRMSSHTPVFVDFGGDAPVVVPNDSVGVQPASSTPAASAPANPDTAPSKEEADAEGVCVQLLKQHNVPFVMHRHECVMTVKAQQEALTRLNVPLDKVLLLKNLFLKGKKGKVVLVTARASAKVDLGALCKKIGVASGSLRFAPEELLDEVLHVKKGAVTPLALMNDKDSRVTFVLDSSVKGHDRVLFHPNHNLATLEVKGDELVALVGSTNHQPVFVDFEDAAEE